MPNLNHKRELEKKLQLQIAAEGVQMIREGRAKEAEVKLRSLRSPNDSLYFGDRMRKEIKKEAGWKGDKVLLPAPDEHEQAIIDLCAANDSLTKEIVADVLANGTVAEKLELLKIVQSGKKAAIKENNLRINAELASLNKAKSPQQNVQVNVTRGGVSVGPSRAAGGYPLKEIQMERPKEALANPSKSPEGPLEAVAQTG
jgi:hypothetical protein